MLRVCCACDAHMWTRTPAQPTSHVAPHALPPPHTPLRPSPVSPCPLPLSPPPLVPRQVEPTLQVKGFPHVFALGDVSDVPEAKQGFLAIQHASLVAASLKVGAGRGVLVTVVRKGDEPEPGGEGRWCGAARRRSAARGAAGGRGSESERGTRGGRGRGGVAAAEGGTVAFMPGGRWGGRGRGQRHAARDGMWRLWPSARRAVSRLLPLSLASQKLSTNKGASLGKWKPNMGMQMMMVSMGAKNGLFRFSG
jgi:hypothetical protein